MPFLITISADAEKQFGYLTVREQRLLESAITARLADQPTQLSRAIKRLRPNPLAAYELRVGDLRVLYNVDVVATEVILLVVGRKVGNTLVVKGEVFDAHQDDPTQ